jgi:hypothetical protein
MVVGVTEKPLIPLIELVTHYREFKSKRTDGVLEPAPYRKQEDRLKLAESYGRDPSPLAEKFSRSVAAFSGYSNVDEALIGRTRTDPASITDVSQITSGPKAAAYLERTLPNGILDVDGLGEYAYVDREIVPARTTVKSLTSANRFDDGSQSTRAMKADLLLRSQPHGRPTIGEVKVSNVKGDDADPVYGLVQGLALAAQLASTNQRRRLRAHYPDSKFADDGPLDVLVFLFLIAESAGKKTHRAKLIEAAAKLCARLDSGLLRPNVEHVALVTAAPQDGTLRFAAF